MKDIVHQLAAQGWSAEAIAAFLHIGANRVEAQLASRGVPAAEIGAGHGRKTAEEIGTASLNRLERQRAQLQAEAAILRAEIERIAEADLGPARGRAKRIQPRLSRPVSLRTVQSHLKEIAQRHRQCASE